MVSFYYNTLNKELKKAIYAKSISTEDLRRIYEKIKQENNKKKKTINMVMIFLAVLLIIICVTTSFEIEDLEFMKFMLLLLIPIIAIIYFLVYFSQIGIMKMQFNRAIKKNYPELASELVL